MPDINFLFLSESLNLSELSFLSWEMGLITTCVGHGDEGRGRQRERMWNLSIVSGHGETGLTCVSALCQLHGLGEAFGLSGPWFL